MAIILPEISRTFNEFLIVPILTKKEHISSNVSLKTPLVRYKKGEESPLSLNIPVVSAAMQAVSDHKMAISLAREGGISFVFGSQTIEEQAEMIRAVKNFKAGFVSSDSNLSPNATIADAIKLSKRTNHSTIAITEDGSLKSRFVGILRLNDIRTPQNKSDESVGKFLIPVNELITAKEGISLSDANDKIWEKKISCLPILNSKGLLVALVFRKDYDEHHQYVNELVDEKKRLIVGAAINSRDYKERVPELVKAGADVLCIDSSDGHSEWQRETIEWVKKTYNGDVKIGAGNVVDSEGFEYLAEAGADFIKIGIGGGSICITREQKGIGLGQASAVMAVAEARNKYFEETGHYIPLCSDGGIVMDYHATIALALGADFVMLGRYFSRFDESPTRKIRRGHRYFKEYWGEGSNRARNWQRYSMGEEKTSLEFEEGVDCYVPYAGHLKDNVSILISKIKSTFCNCGVLSVGEFHKNAKLAIISQSSFREGSSHDVITKESDSDNA